MEIQIFPKTENSIDCENKQTRLWVFTVYDSVNQHPLWRDFLSKGGPSSNPVKDYFIGVEKCPTTHTVHAHIGICFTKNVRYNQLRKFLASAGLTAWMSPMNGSWESARNYAFKEQVPGLNLLDDQGHPKFVEMVTSRRRTASMSSHSNPRAKRNRPSLDPRVPTLVLQGEIDSALKLMTSDQAVRHYPALVRSVALIPERRYPPVVIWLYGDSATGKSMFCRWLQQSKNLSAHWQGVSEHAKFWNGYLGQEMVVLDECRPESLPFTTFLRLSASTPFNVEIKNSFVPMTSPLIFITAPNPPWEFWPETVDERGHAYDIVQVIRRLTMTIRFLPLTYPDPFVLTRQYPWKPMKTVRTFIHGQFQDLSESQALDQMLPHVREMVDLLASGDDVALPVGWEVTSLDKQSVQAIVLTTSQMMIVQLYQKTLLFPAILQEQSESEEISSGVPGNTLQEDSEQWNQDSATSTSEPLVQNGPASGEGSSRHWTTAIRYPKGMTEIFRQSLDHFLSTPVELDVKFVMETRNLMSDIQIVLLDHYFGSFFD